MMMNAGLAHTIESLLGPPSEIVDINSFIQAAIEVESRALLSEGNLQLDGGALDSTVIADCSILDLRDTLFHTWNNPMLSAHLLKDHDKKLTALYTTSKTVKPKRKPNPPDPDSLSPEVANLRRHLDNIQLSCWKLQTDSILFMRSPKNSDQNALAQVKSTSHPRPVTVVPCAIITFSVHNKLAWSTGYTMRVSQHAVLSYHTLEDIFKVIPCTSKDFTDAEHKGVSQSHPINDCVICIEGTAYGYREHDNYTDKLIVHLKTMSKQQTPIKKGATTIHNTSIASLSLRVNQPYWLLHQGNCEHFIVVDQIRFQHPSDASLGYPLTLQITPPHLDLCRVCAKVPAVLSIIGDVRLGESPCLTCDPCWRVMGDPSPGLGVSVKSLPRYK